MQKDGDKLLEQLKQAAERRNKLAILAFARLYQPPWYYWLEFIKLNLN